MSPLDLADVGAYVEANTDPAGIEGSFRTQARKKDSAFLQSP